MMSMKILGERVVCARSGCAGEFGRLNERRELSFAGPWRWDAEGRRYVMRKRAPRRKVDDARWRDITYVDTAYVDRLPQRAGARAACPRCDSVQTFPRVEYITGE